MRPITALITGTLTAIAITTSATLAARALWPAYAAAEPHKAYTLAMLIARLSVAAIATAIAASITTIIARDTGKSAWFLGALFLLVSIPIHIRVWADYPVWYHLLYLASLVPIAGLAGRIAARR